MQCAGLVITAGGLQQLGPVGCSNAGSQWNTLNWGAPIPVIQSGVLPASAAFSVPPNGQLCFPFGGGPSPSPSAAQVQILGIGSSSPPVCLLNIPQM